MTVIATWNVNSIRTRLPHLKEWLKDRDPDIVLLQELKCVEEAFPFEEIEDLGFNVKVLGQKSYNGVAILSKDPIEDLVLGIPGFDDPQARYIEALCGTTRVASIYVPNGQEVGSEKFAYKLRFLKALQDHVQTLLLAGERVVLGGDYNIAPSVADGYNPETFQKDRILCSKAERDALFSLMNIGYLDGYRVKNPEILPENHHHFSWWDYRAGSYESNKGYRIDHLFCSPPAADHIVDAGIDHETRIKERPSDHAPVWLTLD